MSGEDELLLSRAISPAHLPGVLVSTFPDRSYHQESLAGRRVSSNHPFFDSISTASYSRGQDPEVGAALAAHPGTRSA